MIQSMTKKEREDPDSVDGSRRRRIARGSGAQPEDVARLVKGFTHAREFAKKMTGMSMGSRMKMAQAMSHMDMAKLAPGGAGALPRVSSQQPKSRLSPEQKRRLREKRLRGK